MAHGSRAAAQTTARSAARSSQTKLNSADATTSLAAATARARRPSDVPPAASGTTSRFAATPASESWLKCASITGVTAACAPALTAMACASERGHPQAASRSVAAGARWMIPAVATNESAKPGSQRSPGRHASTSSPARASAFMSWDSRSRRTPTSSISPMMVARSTDGWAPTTSAKDSSTSAAITAVGRRASPASDSTANTEDASSATLKPETAST